MNRKIKPRECPLQLKMNVGSEKTSLWSIDCLHLHPSRWTDKFKAGSNILNDVYKQHHDSDLWGSKWCKWLNLTGSSLINSVFAFCLVSGLCFEVVWVISMSHLVMPKREDLIAQYIHYAINWIHPWLMKLIQFDSWKYKWF